MGFFAKNRKWSAALLAASLLMCSASVAEEVVWTAEPVCETYALEDLTDTQALRDGYAERVMAMNDVAIMYSSTSRAHLKPMEIMLYDILSAAIHDIADGRRAETVVMVEPETLGIQTVWTEDEFPGEIYNWETGVVDEELIRNTIQAKYASELNTSMVLTALRYDDPYGLYWKNIHTGISYFEAWNLGFGLRSNESGKLVVTLNGSLKYSFPVDAAYSVGSIYMADTAKTGVAIQAMETAKDILRRANGLGDMARMTMYMQEIRALSEYNYPAADGQVSGSAPWQLIDVFDGDPSTTVVCEGFSKAFQYLCDHTTFNENGLKVYLVSGDMIDLDKMDPGPHMWNIVSTGNRNYLVDITNCLTSGTHETSLFFSEPAAGDLENGYMMERIQSGYLPQSFLYQYDNETRMMYTDAELMLGDLPAPSRVHYLVDGACSECGQSFDTAGMNVLTLPEALTELGAEALKGTAADVIIVSQSVTAIGENALADCDGLQLLFLPVNLESMAENLLKISENLQIILY